MACVGVEHCGTEPSVGQSAPSPVDVNHACRRVIAVGHESMADGYVLSAIQHRASGFDFLGDNAVKFSLRRRFGTFFVGDAGVVAEILGQCCGNTYFVGARTRHSKLGAYACGCVEEKSGHCFGLFFRISAHVIAVQHGVPIVLDVKVHAIVASCSACRKFMMLHYYSHGRADAAYERSVGNGLVERSLLAP